MVVAGQQGIWYFHKSTPTPYPIDNVTSFQKNIIANFKGVQEALVLKKENKTGHRVLGKNKIKRQLSLRKQHSSQGQHSSQRQHQSQGKHSLKGLKNLQSKENSEVGKEPKQ